MPGYLPENGTFNGDDMLRCEAVMYPVMNVLLLHAAANAARQFALTAAEHHRFFQGCPWGYSFRHAVDSTNTFVC